ncbi:MAG: hypothetical protein NT065_03440 [Chlamydiae bacterium]|nr:hypothetical protein [Chlamydiota bacterium]
MASPLVSKKRAKLICFSVFLAGLCILQLTGAWWPGITLAFGIPLALRQFFLRKLYDSAVTLFIFIGTFIADGSTDQLSVILPVMFTLGGIYIFFRDFIETKTTSEVEKEENTNEEIEEEQHPQK